jgi:hypothetical protein
VERVAQISRRGRFRVVDRSDDQRPFGGQMMAIVFRRAVIAAAALLLSMRHESCSPAGIRLSPALSSRARLRASAGTLGCVTVSER